MASRTPQFTSSRAPDHPSRRTPRLQTTGQSSRSQTRYSYLETPVEMQRSTFAPFSSPTNSTIDESPVSALSPSRGLPEYSQHERATPLPDEKAFEASMQAPPTQMHPAFNAPVIAESASTPRQASIPRQNTQAMAPPNPPQSPGPLPIKSDRDYSQMATPMTTSTATPDLKGAETAPLDSYNPHALQGPNVSTANHRPGQVSHPNAIVDPHWKHGLCEPDTSCCMGLLCPCVLYGRTMYRLSRKAERKDPTEMLGYESCNGSCGLFALGCGIQGLSTLSWPPRSWPCVQEY